MRSRSRLHALMPADRCVYTVPSLLLSSRPLVSLSPHPMAPYDHQPAHHIYINIFKKILFSKQSPPIQHFYTQL